MFMDNSDKEMWKAMPWKPQNFAERNWRPK